MRYERDQGDVPGALDGDAQCPLVLCTDSRAPSRFDLRAIRHEASDLVDILVIDDLDVLDAEGADPAPGNKSPTGPATGPSTRPAASRWAATRTPWGTSALGSIRRPVRCFCSH